MNISWKAAVLVPLLAAGCTADGQAAPKKQPAKQAKAKAKPRKVAAPKAAKAQPSKGAPAVLNFTMKSLDGKDVDLVKYKGRVVLMVNVASKCGFTPQYAGLQKLHKKYSGRGLTILGFPANDFGAQEPGSNEDIGAFCQKNYGVEFPMFAKIAVTGEAKAPLFKHLTEEKTNPKHAGEVKWNFEKFLVGGDGQIAARFRSNVAPDSEEMIKAIEAELAKAGK